MTKTPTILVIGTADTKSPELEYLVAAIKACGARTLIMDVGVLAAGPLVPDVENREVAAAAHTTLAEIAASGDENTAMAKMARGAATLARRLYRDGRINGMLALGGTMGTDLALDVAAGLPLGVPKFIVSTIAYSHLVPPDRIPSDLMMILWAGGLYGLNDICRSALAQAAGAIVGACRSATAPQAKRPMIGMTSLGKSCLAYMTALLPALHERGYEVAVFHTTGMGGRAYETLAAEGRFAAVMDFSLQELANYFAGSDVNAGPDRLEGAGRQGVPQIVAPGAIDMIDFPTWKPMAYDKEGRHYHAHNRLIASVTMRPEERRGVARLIAEKLDLATGPTTFLLPSRGIQAWDRPGEPLHEPVALEAFVSEARKAIRPPTRFVELDAHINDQAFTDAALAIFDAWVRDGVVPPGIRDAS